MSKVRVVLNRGNVKSQLLTGGGAPGMCLALAQSYAKSAGPGYEARSKRLQNRIGAIYYPATPQAISDNYAHNTLEKSRGGKF